MPLFVLYAKDSPQGAAVREALRPTHLEYVTRLDVAGQIVFAGPLKDGNRSIGSLIVFEAESEAAARTLMDNDPFTHGGLYESCEVLPVVKVFPKGA